MTKMSIQKMNTSVEPKDMVASTNNKAYGNILLLQLINLKK